MIAFSDLRLMILCLMKFSLEKNLDFFVSLSNETRAEFLWNLLLRECLTTCIVFF